MKQKITWKMLKEQKEFAKQYPKWKHFYLDTRKRFLNQLTVVRAYKKTKWFLSELIGICSAGGDGDCDGHSERYVLRFLFVECYLGSTFSRSFTAPSNVSYNCSHGLEWKLKDLLQSWRWGFNSMWKVI